jgi:hypothetical protein
VKFKIKEALEKRKAEIAAGIVREPEPLIRKPAAAQTAPMRPDFAPNPVLATPPPQREPVERRAVDEFFKQPRKAAIYLIGHGPKREPRPVELQYMRISRYIGMLREAGSNLINISDEPYIDLNMRRYEYSGLADHFPQFEALLRAVQAKDYEVIFTDIRNP